LEGGDASATPLPTRFTTLQFPFLNSGFLNHLILHISIIFRGFDPLIEGTRAGAKTTGCYVEVVFVDEEARRGGHWLFSILEVAEAHSPWRVLLAVFPLLSLPLKFRLRKY